MNLLVNEHSILCESEISVHILGETYEFPKFCLESGGKCYYDGNYSIVTERGPWTIKKWPVNFPPGYKSDVLKQLNEMLPWGCCGGCVDEDSI